VSYLNDSGTDVYAQSGNGCTSLSNAASNAASNACLDVANVNNLLLERRQLVVPVSYLSIDRPRRQKPMMIRLHLMKAMDPYSFNAVLCRLLSFGGFERSGADAALPA